VISGVLEALRTAGCMSHSCRIMPPRGQGTNGPCRCLDGMDPERRRALGHALAQVRLALGVIQHAVTCCDKPDERKMGPMRTFEHKDERSVDRDEVVRVADRLGSLGWELVSVTVPPVQSAGPHRCDLYFRREVESRPRVERTHAVGMISAPNSACAAH